MAKPVRGPLPGSAPTSSAPGDTAAAGTVGDPYALESHKHTREAWGVVGDVQPGSFTAAAGSTGRTADAGHAHAIAAAVLCMQWMEVSP